MENLESETFQTWDKLAEIYWDKFSRIRIYDHTYDRFIENLPPFNPSVLDVSCGPGIISHYIKSKNKTAQITGVDVSPNMIRKAMQMIPDLDGLVMKMQDIGQIQQKFDGILCGFGLPYLNHDETKDFINQCYSFLLEKGVLYFSFVEGDLSDPEIKTDNNGNRIHFFYHQTKVLTDILNKAGFTLTDKWSIPYPSLAENTQEHIVIMAHKNI